jgi:flagellin
MSSDIVLSAGIRSNLLALQQTTDLIGTTQNRLATGKKVNSAVDNPVNFFVASAFRASASSLEALLDSINLGQKTLDAANTGITSLTTLLNSAQATLTQALASASTTATYTGTVAGLAGTSSFAVTSGHTITVSDGTTSATITSTGALTVQQILDGVNTTVGLKVKAELSGDGRILLEATQNNTIVIAGSATPAEQAQYGIVAGTTNAGTTNATRTSLAAQFDSLRTQIDQLAVDSGFNGVSLLNGQSLKLVFNEKATSSLVLTGVTDTSAGLGVSASTNSLQTNFDINAAVANVANALATLRNQASSFAANVAVIQARQDFTKHMVNTLQTGADGLTLADQNEEGANMLALQTRQQLSSTALSLATQADRNVLRLFGG